MIETTNENRSLSNGGDRKSINKNDNLDNTIKSPTVSDLIIRNLEENEIPALQKWIHSDVGWNLGSVDLWKFFLRNDPTGWFVGELSSPRGIIGNIICMRIDGHLALIGVYVINKEYRYKGFGVRLWNAMLEHAGTRILSLYSVGSAVERYKKLGFKDPTFTLNMYSAQVKKDRDHLKQDPEYQRKFFQDPYTTLVKQKAIELVDVRKNPTLLEYVIEYDTMVHTTPRIQFIKEIFRDTKNIAIIAAVDKAWLLEEYGTTEGVILNGVNAKSKNGSISNGHGDDGRRRKSSQQARHLINEHVMNSEENGIKEQRKRSSNLAVDHTTNSNRIKSSKSLPVKGFSCLVKKYEGYAISPLYADTPFIAELLFDKMLDFVPVSTAVEIFSPFEFKTIVTDGALNVDESKTQLIMDFYNKRYKLWADRNIWNNNLLKDARIYDTLYRMYKSDMNPNDKIRFPNTTTVPTMPGALKNANTPPQNNEVNEMFMADASESNNLSTFPHSFETFTEWENTQSNAYVDDESYVAVEDRINRWGTGLIPMDKVYSVASLEAYWI